MKKIIVGNWKCNPSSAKKAEALFKASDRADVVICPPFVFLAGANLKSAALGAQDVFWEEGAYTGEVSPAQLKGLGVKYVIVGHSERRAMGDTDDIVMKKALAVIKAGMKAIVCVGEPDNVRREGVRYAEKFVALQMAAVDSVISSGKLIIAYEPLWAIGSGRPAAPEDAVSMISHIRSCCANEKIKILYGGSVSPENAAAFLAKPEIDGLLVGGASANPAEFKKIVASL